MHPAQRPALARLRAAWVERNAQRFDQSMQALARHLRACASLPPGDAAAPYAQQVQALCPSAVLLRATWMYDLPGYRLPIRGNLPLNLLRAAQRGESVRFSVWDFRGITYVRQAVALLEAALTLPGGVYNFGSENAENMVLTARQFAETLGITVDIQEADWARNLAMDCSKLRAQGIVFDTTQAGLTRCLRDYGLL